MFKTIKRENWSRIQNNKGPRYLLIRIQRRDDMNSEQTEGGFHIAMRRLIKV